MRACRNVVREYHITRRYRPVFHDGISTSMNSILNILFITSDELLLIFTNIRLTQYLNFSIMHKIWNWGRLQTMDTSELHVSFYSICIICFKFETLFFKVFATFRYMSPASPKSWCWTTPRYVIDVHKQHKEYARSHTYFSPSIEIDKVLPHRIDLVNYIHYMRLKYLSDVCTRSTTTPV